MTFGALQERKWLFPTHWMIISGTILWYTVISKGLFMDLSFDIILSSGLTKISPKLFLKDQRFSDAWTKSGNRKKGYELACMYAHFIHKFVFTSPECFSGLLSTATNVEKNASGSMHHRERQLHFQQTAKDIAKSWFKIIADCFQENPFRAFCLTSADW